jgi:hypothetical protein
LCHLYPPYEKEDPDGPERESGVLLWQENLWRDIVAAALCGDSRSTPFAADDRLQLPAASRYSATTPTILGWFRRYNEGRPYAEQIRPFGFLRWFHAKRPDEHFWQEGAETTDWDPRARAPKPAGLRRDHYARRDRFQREAALPLGAALTIVALSYLGLWWVILLAGSRLVIDLAGVGNRRSGGMNGKCPLPLS